MKVPVYCLSAVILANALPAFAQEWSRFRGPNGQGVNTATTVPAAFTEADYKYKIPLPGAGTSSPVLWGQKLFLTSQSSEDGKRLVLVFDSATGKELHRYTDTYKPHSKHNFNNFASSTPAVDEARVYIAWTTHGGGSGKSEKKEMRVLALDHTAKRLWEVSLGNMEEDHGSGASPVVVGNILVVPKDHGGQDSFIAGLDVTNGAVKWKLPRQTHRTAFSTPLVIEDKPGHPIVLLNSNPKALTAINPADGKVLWEWDYKEKTEFRAVGSPCFCDGVIFAAVGQGNGGRECVALRLVDGKPEEAWTLTKGMPYVPTALGVGKLLYILNDTGILLCLKASSGEEVYNERLVENAYSSPVCVGDKIFCISRKGTVKSVKTGESFQLLGESDLGEPCESTPAVANGMMFIRTAGHLIALGGAKPQASNFHKAIGVEMEFGSEVASIQPGTPFTVGVRLKHEPQFHTYWKNSGIVGVPYHLRWSLPEGWKVGEMQYQAPEKVAMAALWTYGYEKDTTLFVELTPPREFPAGTTTFTLTPKAVWMCCAKTCHPGAQDLSLTLPVKNEPPAFTEWKKIFDAARAALPKPATGWRFAVKRSAKQVVLTGTLEPGSNGSIPKTDADPLFFSDNNFICSNEPQRWEWTDNGFIATLTISQFAPKDVTALTGLLYAPSGWHQGGEDAYVEINVPLSQQISQN